MSGLLNAIRPGKPWLDRFTRRDYEEAFREYGDRFAPLFRTALEETAPDALAVSLLDGLEEARRKTRLWDRSVERVSEKQMMVVYLSPMLLQQGWEALARSLREEWCRRWPKDPYDIAPYDVLRYGFRSRILGIDLPDRR
ncbi:MAG: hypothetical protein IJ713_03265 [Oscillibacter sp.]|nr:hypothetical protein [Oscillibacter sp.]